jgi:hypothetical protein
MSYEPFIMNFHMNGMENVGWIAWDAKNSKGEH